MREVSDKKSRLLYQRGNKATQGVVDLRCFASERSGEMRPSANRAPKSSARPLDLRRVPRNLDIAGTEKPFQEVKPVQAEAPTLPRRRVSAVSDTEDNKDYRELDFPKEWSTRAKRGKAAGKVPARTASLRRLPSLPTFDLELLSAYRRRSFARFVIASFLIPAIIFSFSFAQSQFDETGRVLGVSTEGINNLKSAALAASAADFSLTDDNFDAASMNFSEARRTIDSIGLGVGEVVGQLPIETPISSAQELTAVGENVSLAGKDLSAILEKVSAGIADDGGSTLSLQSFTGLEADLGKASMHLKNANESIQKVDARYIPDDMKAKFELARTSLPGIARNFERLAEDYPSFIKMLGSEHAQKYLLLFENSSEMRATGGFIGSYGILDIDSGRIENLTIDGIFNPDGQLKETIVPPMPIQKISANWSMHDSNWFADYPTSAQKTALFYEKTGGPTVDGVIAITPNVLERFLEITGPIEMSAYGVTLTADNFLTETQDEVETQYDKEENAPKKILSDLAPILIERLFKAEGLDRIDQAQRLLSVIEAVEESLHQKDILIYHRDEAIEKVLQKRGWGGEIIQNQSGDYLSVINTNINGYKSDAMIEESIDLKTSIAQDGTIVNTVTIKRKHKGGNEKYDWYNRVNADYMRVYVPQGSVLLEASGNTVEEYAAPVDYTNYKTDPDVQAVESTIRIDPASRTQIFEESGKTVFGNWVFVSPQEEVTVVYKYQLPFKLDFEGGAKTVDVYSAIIQKQAGSEGSHFTATLETPAQWQSAWQTANMSDGKSVARDLATDLIYAEIFARTE